MTRAWLNLVFGAGLLWAMSLPALAHAQINAEAIRSQLTRNTKMAAIESSLVTRAGNTQGVVFSGGIMGALVYYRHLAFGRTQADYVSSEGNATVSRGYGHLRYNYRIDRPLAIEVFGQLQSDKFRRLTLRQVAGVGPRWEIIDRDSIEVFVATAYMFENEVLSEIPEDRRRDELHHRWSSYAGINLVMDERLQLTTVTYMQPRFDKPRDFRLLHETSLIFGINKLLSAKLSASIRYDHEPPVLVKPIDAEIKNSLVLQF